MSNVLPKPSGEKPGAGPVILARGKGGSLNGGNEEVPVLR